MIKKLWKEIKDFAQKNYAAGYHAGWNRMSNDLGYKIKGNPCTLTTRNGPSLHTGYWEFEVYHCGRMSICKLRFNSDRGFTIDGEILNIERR